MLESGVVCPGLLMRPSSAAEAFRHSSSASQEAAPLVANWQLEKAYNGPPVFRASLHANEKLRIMIRAGEGAMHLVYTCTDSYRDF